MNWHDTLAGAVGGLRLDERDAADEAARLVEIDGKAKPGLEWIDIGGQFPSPCAKALLDAHGLERVVAGIEQSEAAAGLMIAS